MRKTFIKKIPRTNRRQYISGWYALNTPLENGEIADWHPDKYWYSNSDISIELTSKPIDILGYDGIDFRIINWNNEREYIANYPRAIADLLIELKPPFVFELRNCVRDFLTFLQAEELFKYASIINKHKNIEWFLKEELTDLYFEKFSNINQAIISKENKRNRVVSMKQFLETMGNIFVIKGSIALKLYYGLDRYSDNIELDSLIDIEDILICLSKKLPTAWKMYVTKSTSTEIRIQIDYGDKYLNGEKYMLDIIITTHSKGYINNHLRNSFIQIGKLKTYNILQLIRMKVNTYGRKESISDVYDIGYLLENYIEHFTIEQLENIIDKTSFQGVDSLSLLLNTEIKNKNLVERNIETRSYIHNIETIAENRIKELRKGN